MVRYIHEWSTWFFEYYEIFLNMLREDEQEYAVLLCNYFFFFGKLSWVRKVLGKAVPDVVNVLYRAKVSAVL